MDNFCIEERWEKVFSSNGLLFLPDCPAGLEVGLDTISHITGNDFKGITFIPPGLHFFYYNYSNLPRYGFFFYVNNDENFFFYQWDKKEEEFIEYNHPNKNEAIQGIRSQILRGDYNKNLVSYSTQQNNLWMNLIQFISINNFQLLKMNIGTLIHPEYGNEFEENKEKTNSLKIALGEYYDNLDKDILDRKSNLHNYNEAEMEVEESEDSGLKFENFFESSSLCYFTNSSEFYPTKYNRPQYINHDELIHLNFNLFHKHFNRYLHSKRSKELSSILTSFSIDYSWFLNFLLKTYYNNEIKNLLGEIQLSYILFLFSYSISSLNYWKKLIFYICNSEQFLIKNLNFSSSFIHLFYNQLKFVSADLFDDNFFNDNPPNEKSKKNETRNNFFLSVIESLFNILNTIEISYKKKRTEYEIEKEKAKDEYECVLTELNKLETIIINKKKIEKFLNKKFNITFRTNTNQVEESFFYSNIRKYIEEVNNEDILENNFQTFNNLSSLNTSTTPKKSIITEDVDCFYENNEKDFNLNEKMYEILSNPKTLKENINVTEEIYKKMSELNVDNSNMEILKYSWRYPLLSEENQKFKDKEDFIMTAMRIYDQFNEDISAKGKSSEISDQEKLYNEAVHFINNEIA